MPKTNTNIPHRVPPYRRPIIIVGFALLILIIAGIVFFIFSSQKPAKDPSPVKPEDSSSSEQSPSENQDNGDKPSAEPDQRPPQYEGEDPNTLDELTGRIAYRSIDYDNGIMTVMLSIDQYLSAGGECNLQLVTDDQTAYSTTLPATADVTTSVCGPFEIPITDLASGLYQLEIKISGDGKTGTVQDEIQL